MKFNKRLLAMLFLLCSVTACKKDFLDVVDKRELSRQGYVRNLSSMEEFLNGMYVTLNRLFEHGMGAAYPELSADNLKPLISPPKSLMLHYTWSQQKDESSSGTVGPSSLNMNGIWKAGYELIRECNFVIEEADKYRNEKPDKADDIKGQAYAIRGLIYFKLVNIFAQHYTFTPEASHPGVPYITTFDISAPYTRQTVAEVYNGMISDFNNAIDLLPATVKDTRYMNRSATKALLARIYLFKEDYSNARSTAQEICSQVPLLTIAAGYPNEMFSNKSPVETEVLFQVTPGDLYYSNFIGGYLRGNNLSFYATNDIAALLKENVNDARSEWVTNTNGDWYVNKFPESIAGLRAIPAADYYQPMIRSSEMFLTAAEACAKTGDDNNARTYLDAIRKRADPSIANLTASGSALMDSIYKERRKELAFEGLRMYDLQRWKQGVNRTDVLNGSPPTLPYPSNKAIAPIPILDVRLAGLAQNNDY